MIPFPPVTDYDESTNPGNGWAVQPPSATHDYSGQPEPRGCDEFDNPPSASSDDMSAPFDDMPNDLAALNAPSRSKAIKVERPTFRVGCLKCRGTGRYAGPSSHGSACFACSGVGYRETKTDPTKLAANRAKAATKKAVDKSNAILAWRAANPVEAQWIDANEGTFDFATAMSNALVQWGSLTIGQLGGIQRCIEGSKAREAARAVAQIKQEARSVEVNVGALEAAFAKAGAVLKKPRITLNKTTFKPASAKAKPENIGAIYVTRNHGDSYLGKVLRGKFFPSRDCTPDLQTEIVEMMNDPRRAAESYGRLTGNCCICSRPLVDPVSVARGIGPICAERFGW